MVVALWIFVPVALFLGFLLNVALMGPRTKNLRFRSREPWPTPSRGRIAPLVNVVVPAGASSGARPVNGGGWGLEHGEPRSGPYGT